MSSFGNASNTANYLSSNRATINFPRLNGLNLTVQEFRLPEITLDAPIAPNPYIQRPVPGETLTYGDFDLTFIVSEDMSNWLEIMTWMRKLASPVDKSEECKLLDYIYSDAVLTIYSSHNNPVVRFKFIDCIPVSLGGIDFTEQDSETVIKTSTVMLKYERFDVEVC